MFGFFKKSPEKTNQDNFKKLSKPYFARILETGRCSPEDEAAINSLASRFGIDLNIDDMLHSQKALWEHDNNSEFKLRSIECDIELEDGEVCYNSCLAVWRLRDQSPLPLIVGNISEIKSSAEVSQGSLYITNQNIIFVGHPESYTCPLNDISQWNISGNKLLITDSTGHNFNFELEPAQSEYNRLLLTQLA